METYETGATSHAVNDLILFADNTRELTELRDNIYKNWMEKGNPYGHEWTLTDQFQTLLQETEWLYRKQFPNKADHSHTFLTAQRGKEKEVHEFCSLYANDFENWKKEHGYLS